MLSSFIMDCVVFSRGLGLIRVRVESKGKTFILFE